jgi:CDP-2,3-bis-(O-geranylgeranyl)-sn-glycerol synthase
LSIALARIEKNTLVIDILAKFNYNIGNMTILLILLQAFYFALPAYLANMSPVIIDKLGWLKFLKKPVDGGRLWRGQPILGQGKTWRGLIAGVLTAICAAGLQKYLFQFPAFQNISVVDFSRINFILFGALSGSGALLGDLIKSFFKRRIAIASGKSWPIFDQWDFVLGFILFTYFLVRPDIKIILSVFLITLLLHPLANIVGYLLKIKKVWW